MSIRLEEALMAVDRLSQEDYTPAPLISDKEINEAVHSIESFSMESFYYSSAHR